MQAIADYIAKDSPKNADIFIETMVKLAKSIPRFPNRGRMVPEVKEDNIRELLSGSYRLIYEISEEEITVLTIIHQSRILKL